ncbi:acylphosphatase [Salipaludibacillus agaradhaerens]|jgi:D-alanine-D-alanine ligase-like ATP-grasp enzyme/acylphosphatase|uniref:acylphosphatase n=1 Tax=Salipaludibacillus agaradhaerens TaxID=76935 RepID=UPI00215191D9|nr:acylphosphatase [Salipaludibacillus agaradhaerens]MCR6108171.1 acylphosphatase [Salipaludibacillus agaradhaerens]MCR6120196.1 acylphosphatase [Salipaludibacillus agaradhaerens]
MEDIPGENFLPHLSKEVVADAKGPYLDAFAIALEGWRRGLKLTWYAKNAVDFPKMRMWNVEKPGKLFSLTSSHKTHYFFRTRGDKVTNEAVDLCMDKQLTKERLDEKGVPIPAGKRFDKNTSTEAVLKYASSIGYPLVLKPIDGSFGHGVYVNIKSSEALQDILDNSDANQTDFIVERFIPGDEYRVYVVEGKAVGMILRKPANVKGDGFSSIRRLIDQKNELRQDNPRLISCPIKITNEIRNYLYEHNYDLDDIIPENKIVKLTEKSNISLGGDPISVDMATAPKVAEAAIAALNVVPGLPHGAVDVIWDKVSGDVAVLEINPSAQIGSLLFPLEGPAFDVPSAIIDAYFPETKNVDIEREKLYFDFTDVLFPLKSKTATKTTVTPAITEGIIVKKFTVFGDVQGIDFHRGLRKQAFERYLNGFVMNLSNGEIEVIVAGTDENKIYDFEKAIWEDPERSSVEKVEVSSYNLPVKIGFEIKADLKTQLEELNLLKKEIEQTEKKYRKLKKRNQQLKGSLSWKVSAPIRLLGDAAKLIKLKR